MMKNYYKRLRSTNQIDSVRILNPKEKWPFLIKFQLNEEEIKIFTEFGQLPNKFEEAKTNDDQKQKEKPNQKLRKQ